jgi:hypothetical protein
MKRLLLTFIASCLLFAAGCFCPPERKQPERPSVVVGWDHFSADRPDSEAEFVLNKGESTDNGTIGIEVVDILPPVDRCAEIGSYSTYPRVELQFYRPSDRKVLCQDTWIQGSIHIGGNGDCEGQPMGFDNLVVSHINTSEKWVHLTLRGPFPLPR